MSDVSMPVAVIAISTDANEDHWAQATWHAEVAAVEAAKADGIPEDQLTVSHQRSGGGVVASSSDGRTYIALVITDPAVSPASYGDRIDPARYLRARAQGVSVFFEGAPANAIADDLEADDLLPGCAVPAMRRVPDRALADTYAQLFDSKRSDVVRAAAFDAFAVRSGATALAGSWLLETPSSHQDDLRKIASLSIGNARYDTSPTTRSDHILAMCYVTAAKAVPAELSRRAAAELVSLCLDAGYQEARRLLPKGDWSWLAVAVREETWAFHLALEFLSDLTTPLSTRMKVAIEFVTHAPSPVVPPSVDELVRSPKASSTDRLSLATAWAKRDPKAGQLHLDALARDHTLQQLHRVQAAEHLLRLNPDAGSSALAALTDDRRLSPAARELASRSLQGS
ncbi:hypothetical protein [Actinoallomurus iriomotensis]|uniref:Uncharacterized protein n=1 Tax=Actinoallomurus iriomotensis TaxID=478107 RepID=A0A9W6VUB1_9ACTN|nr:hypothetical protein [Actinoallomurus iriomotensis]GLY80585.1 hypothetical protein Airi01_088520 [Actinoallomurus iriomotensis]